MECNFFKKFDQGSFQLVHKFDTIKTEYSDIIKKENSNETISAFNYQDKHEKLSKFSIIALLLLFKFILITLLNEQLAQDYKKKKNKPDFCENLPNPDIP